MNSVFLAFLGTTELIIVLIIVVLVFGVGKLPEVGKQLGQGIKNFKSEIGTEGENKSIDADRDVTPRDVTDEHRRNEA